MGTKLTPAMARRLGIPLPAAEQGTKRVQGAVRTEYNGRWYMSKAEAARARELDEEVAQGLVEGWAPQVRYSLTSKTAPFIVSYVLDFYVRPALHNPRGSRPWVEDVKGYGTQLWDVKARLFVDQYPDLPLWIVKGGKATLYVETKKRKTRKPALQQHQAPPAPKARRKAA